MKSFVYTIKDELGIHARPAGLLCAKAKEFESEIRISLGEKSVNLTKLMALMTMGIKCGDTVTVTASGNDEDKAVKELEKFFYDNL